ncbi:hypothetical protein VB776_09150 [Arcicella sp. DC2W]|uniref:Lipoprotein n=1 Tax=Arcicella gelida TaxID=2984195 RepID=A0ABU5S3Q6_9BACT|nr:hypothetical protein [Arcicella sp. DC2W]MEA5403080.1 hypothetical protein [Arcicella sp. DC2W]
MKTKSFLLLLTGIFLSVFSSCKKDADTTPDNNLTSLLVCGTKDPINDLNWLSDEMKFREFYRINSEKINGVVLYDYKGDNVIEIQCSLCSSTNIHQYKCDGTKINFTNSNNYNDYLKNRTKVKVLYGTEIWTF